MRGDAVVAGGSAPVSGRRPARVDVSDADVESLWASKRESLVAARRSRELAAVEARLARLAESAESASARGDARLKTLLRHLKLAERDEAQETAAATRAARVTPSSQLLWQQPPLLPLLCQWSHSRCQPPE